MEYARRDDPETALLEVRDDLASLAGSKGIGLHNRKRGATSHVYVL